MVSKFEYQQSPISSGQTRQQERTESPSWISYPLDSRENLDQFIRDMIKATWTGRVGTRQASTINAATKLLLEFRGWIPRQPQEPENRVPVKTDPRVDEAMRKLPQEEKIALAKALRRLREIRESATGES